MDGWMVVLHLKCSVFVLLNIKLTVPLGHFITTECNMFWKMSWVFSIRTPGLHADPVLILFPGSFMAGGTVSQNVSLTQKLPSFFLFFLRPPCLLWNITLRTLDRKKDGKWEDHSVRLVLEQQQEKTFTTWIFLSRIWRGAWWCPVFSHFSVFSSHFIMSVKFL